VVLYRASLRNSFFVLRLGSALGELYVSFGRGWKEGCNILRARHAGRLTIFIMIIDTG